MDALKCEHDPVFPMSIYTGIIYVLTPIITAIGMIGGLGGGILKGPVLEMMLDYNQAIAT